MRIKPDIQSTYCEFAGYVYSIIKRLSKFDGK